MPFEIEASETRDATAGAAAASGFYAAA